MKEYRVYRSANFGWTDVEAENEDEAIELASQSDMWHGNYENDDQYDYEVEEQ